jgi:hypothetical protein
MKSKAKLLLVIVSLGLAACVVSPPASSTTAENLTGVWYFDFSETYLQLKEDGTFGFADSVQELEEAPFDAGQYRLEGTSLTFMTDNESLYCRSKTGSYEVELTEEGHLQFVLQEDPCWERRSALPAEPWVWVEP